MHYNAFCLFIKGSIIFLLCSSCFNDKTLTLLKVYQKKYDKLSSFYGEVYASCSKDLISDTTTLKKACIRLLPEIASDIAKVKFHILYGEKNRRREVVVYKDITELKFEFLDETDTTHQRRVQQLIDKKLWNQPKNLVGIWNVHDRAFIYSFKEDGILKIETYHYDGTRQQNKFPEVREVVLSNGEKYFNHTWASDLMGPDEKFYQINKYGDLVYYEPMDFMQYIFTRIEL